MTEKVSEVSAPMLVRARTRFQRFHRASNRPRAAPRCCSESIRLCSRPRFSGTLAVSVIPNVSIEQIAPLRSNIDGTEPPCHAWSTTLAVAESGAAKKMDRNQTFKIAALIARNART